MSVLTQDAGVRGRYRYHAGLWTITMMAAAMAVHGMADVPFPYARTIYVENVSSPAAWWTSPALACRVDVPMLLTANATPVGKIYTVSSVRFITPLRNGLRLGVGVSGIGEKQNDTFHANNGGIDYRSRFVFSRPDFELGVAYPFARAGNAGVLVKGGVETADVGAGQHETFGVVTLSAGWTSPLLWGTVVVCGGLQWTGHLRLEPYWEGEGKVGVYLVLPEQLAALDIVYAGPLPRWLCPGAEDIGWSYRAVKALVSIRTSRLISLLAGASSDFRTVDEHNGTCLHGGLELMASDDMPFIGGYELGISLNERWHFLHRAWLGVRIRLHEKREQMTVQG